MIPIGPARECDVVLAFLKAEIDYSDSREQIQKSIEALGLTREELIDQADLENEHLNYVRAALLEYRGYLSRGPIGGLFIGFPRKVDWRRVELEPSDFDRLLYLANDAGWDSRSDRTRKPQRVADKIDRGELPEEFAGKVTDIQKSLKRENNLPELVAVEGEGNSLVLIEGAHRVTAYVRSKWKLNVPAIIGSSPLMTKWHWYAYRP